MKALDRLKMDIGDYNEVLASRMIELKKQVDYLYDNYDNLTVKSIKLLIEGLNNEMSIISKDDNILRKMEEYYRLFKTEQDPEITCKKDKKDTKDKFQLCVVQGGEEIVNAEVTTDEFIQIMHEQAEEEQEKNKYNGIATEIEESGLLGGARYK